LEYAGISGIGERFSNIELTDSQGKAVTHRRMIPGEFLAGSPFAGWSYTVELAPLTIPSAAAHVSWLNADGGILMLDDLLPQTREKKAQIKFELPSGWGVMTNELSDKANAFGVNDIEKAVFYIYKLDSSTNVSSSSKSRLRVLISGKWLFSREEANGMAEDVFRQYKDLFGSVPRASSLIGIHNFPRSTAIGNWEADTRGSTITIVSSDMPFKSQSLQRVHEQLRHEIFHLWIPNGVNLSGNYDWFYEGFALYQSLKVGVAANRIRFDDLLDTLSRAYTIDNGVSKRISLVDASKNRWTGSANTDVYARGLLVAFLCDLATMERSKGKLTTESLLREIYERHGATTASVDGNTAVLTYLRSKEVLIPIVSKYIEGNERIAWEPYLKFAGLEAVESGSSTILKVSQKPSGRQKDLLNKLGYNSWRKLSPKQ
jgi:predicted metalloprotease with PDZ domain